MKKTAIILSIVTVAFCSKNSFSQYEKCGTMQLLEQHKKNDKSLNVKMKLKLVSLMLVWAMVFCLNSVVRADSPERFAGPSPSPSGDDNSERVIQPTKPTFAPPLGDVNSYNSDVRLRRLKDRKSVV